MHKNFKKQLALVLTILMVFSSMATAFAGESYEPNREYRLSAELLAEGDLEQPVTLYPVAKLLINANGQINQAEIAFQENRIQDFQLEGSSVAPPVYDPVTSLWVYTLPIQDLSSKSVSIQLVDGENYDAYTLVFDAAALALIGDEAVVENNTDVNNDNSNNNDSNSSTTSDNPVLFTQQTNNTYIDGTYYGRAYGFRAPDYTYVTIVIENDLIASIEVTSHADTPRFFERAEQPIIDQILQLQGIDGVDAVSGATYSSKGIKDAVQVALEKAKVGDTSDYSGNPEENIFASGDGSSSDPFMVANEVNLRAFAASVTEGTDYLGKYIKLAQSISLTGEEWAPIGDSENGFAGYFDGAGNTISGLVIGSAAAPKDLYHAGLFGYLKSNSVVKDLGLVDVQIYNRTNGGSRVGGFVAYNGGLIDGCYVTGSISAESVSQNNFCGGLAAYNEGTIANSYTDTQVSSKANSYWAEVGGIAGMNMSNIVNSYSLGSVQGDTSTNYAAVGGIAGINGHHGGGVILNCYAFGPVTSVQASTHVGAIVGDCEGTVWKSYWNSDAKQRSNGVDLSEKKAIGTYADSSIENVFSMSAEVMQSQNFADTLNLSLNSIDKATLPNGVNLQSWVLGTNGYVGLTKNTITPPTPGDLVITSEAELRALAASVSAGESYAGKTVTLANNLTLTQEWTPIGTMNDTFDGVFDGCGYAIDGMQIGSALNPTRLNTAGLFGGIGASAKVVNVGVTNAQIYATYESASIVGGIAAYNNGGLIDSCYVTGVVSGQTTGHNAFVGGVAGYNYGTILNSFSSAEVHSEAISTKNAEAGGFVGINNGGLISNSYATGDVYAQASGGAAIMVGAFAGYNFGSLENCYASGGVISANAARAGLFTGYNVSAQKSVYWNNSAKFELTGNPNVEKVAVGLDEGQSENVVSMNSSDLASMDFARRLNSNQPLLQKSELLKPWGVNLSTNQGMPILDGVGNQGVSSVGSMLTAKISAKSAVYMDDNKTISYTILLDGVNRANMFEVLAKFDSDVLKYEGYTINLPAEYPTMNLGGEVYNAGSGVFNLSFAIAKQYTTFSTNGMTPMVTINFTVREGTEIGTNIEALLESFEISVVNDQALSTVHSAEISLPKITTTVSLTKLIYDFNGDGKFDKADISSIIFNFYLTRQGDSVWASAQPYDMNQDNIIDLVDIITLYTLISK